MTVLAAAGPSAFWYLTRATGTVALVLLTASVALGVLDVGRVASPRWPRFAIDRIHRDVSLLVLALLAVHIVTSVLDAFAPLLLVDAVAPFVSSYRPLWVGLGALAFDVLLAVALTSVLRRRIGFRAWRLVHWVAYVSWPLTVLHTLGTGTDARSVWLTVVEVACLAVVLAAVVWRAARAAGAPRLVRSAALATTVALPAGLAAFALLGPFAPHWARRAGTPVTLLRTAALVRLPGSPGGAVRGGSGRGLARGDRLPRTFQDRLAGTVRESPVTGGAVVDLLLRCSGDVAGTLRARLAGSPVPGGGLALSGSEVQFTAGGLTQALQGRIVRLAGQNFAARVRNAAGTAAVLRVALAIDSAAGTVTGTLVGDSAP